MRNIHAKKGYRMFNYLRSNCDIGCKTVWSEVLLCIKEDLCSSFSKEYHGSDIIYMCATSFMMLLKSHDLNVDIFGAKHGISCKSWLLLKLQWYTNIQACNILPPP